MAKRAGYRQLGAGGGLGLNMTPMIDCVFQLIIFFILAGQVASKSLPTLALHRPDASQAIPSKEIKTPNRVIVNVLSAADENQETNPALAGEAKRYEIDGNPIPIGDFARLVKFLTRRKGQSGAGDFYLEIRADHRVDFGDVQPVMLAAAEARIVKMNITALTVVGEE